MTFKIAIDFSLEECYNTIMTKIIVDPKILVGKPIVAGTRIPVYLILNLLGNGYDFKRITKAYPVLKKEDIKAAIKYSEERMKREEVRLFNQSV